MKKILLVIAVLLTTFFIYKWVSGKRPSGAPEATVQKEAPATPEPPKEDPPLILAIQTSLGNSASEARLAELLKQGADPNTTDLRGRTALSLAIRTGNARFVETLLEAGAEVNRRDTDTQWTPLMHASFEAARNPGNLAILELLLKRGADVQLGKDGTKALHVAINNLDAKAKDAKVVEALLHAGANPNADTEGASASIAPLTLAAWGGKTAAALALVKGGASLQPTTPGAQSAAEIARAHQHPELAALLEKLAKTKPTAAPKKRGRS